jgi:hypothetical protein
MNTRGHAETSAPPFSEPTLESTQKPQSNMETSSLPSNRQDSRPARQPSRRASTAPEHMLSCNSIRSLV